MRGNRRTYILAFGYRGDGYYGLQPQPDYPTVGGTIREALVGAGVAPRGLSYASRTDRGVHAIRNLLTFWTKEDVPPLEELNASLRSSLKTRGIFTTELIQGSYHDHARNISRGKWYRYNIAPGPTTSSSSPCVWAHDEPLDLSAMRAAAEYLIGEHDFLSFAGPLPPQQDTTRTIERFDLQLAPSGIQIDVEGDGFLRYQIRRMVGFLSEVGSGQRPVKDAAMLLQERDRELLRTIAPAHGLILVEVKNDFVWTESAKDLLASFPASTGAKTG